MLAAFMDQLSKDFNLSGNFSTEPAGNYAIDLGDVLIAIAPLAQGGFYLSCNFSPCPQTNKETFLAYLLQANFLGQGTYGAVLGTTPDGNLLTVSKAVEYTVNYEKFRDTLEDFINVVDFWRKEALKHK